MIVLNKNYTVTFLPFLIVVISCTKPKCSFCRGEGAVAVDRFNADKVTWMRQDAEDPDGAELCWSINGRKAVVGNIRLIK